MIVSDYLRESTERDDEYANDLVLKAGIRVRVALADLFRARTVLAERRVYSKELTEAARKALDLMNEIRSLVGQEVLDEKRAIFGEET